MTFIILQDNLGFYQGDFGLTNILYKKINKTKKYFEYNINGIIYKIPNEGYKIVIADYGNAIINKFILADYEKNYYYKYLENRIELYEILLLLNKKIKCKVLQDIIYEKIRFKLFNDIYTIDINYTTPANKTELLNKLYNKEINCII